MGTTSSRRRTAGVRCWTSAAAAALVLAMTGAACGDDESDDSAGQGSAASTEAAPTGTAAQADPSSTDPSDTPPSEVTAGTQPPLDDGLADTVGGTVVWEADHGWLLGTVGDLLLAEGGPLRLVDLTTGRVRAEIDPSTVPGGERWGAIWTDGTLVLASPREIEATVAVDAETGVELWRHDLPQLDEPADGVFLVAEGARVGALDVATGQELWHREGDLVGEPRLDEGLVVWTDGSGILHAVDASTGDARWQTPGLQVVDRVLAVGRTRLDVPEPHDGTVLATNGDAIVGLDPVTGSTRWTATLPGGIDRVTTGFGTVAVWVEEEPGTWSTLLGLDSTTGEERWRVDLDPRRPGLIASFAPGTMTVVSEGETVVDLYRGVVHDCALCGSNVARDGTVVGGDPRTIAAIDPAGGGVLWEVEVLHRGTVVLGDTVVSVRPDGGLDAWALADGSVRWTLPSFTDIGAVAIPSSAGVLVQAGPDRLALVR